MHALRSTNNLFKPLVIRYPYFKNLKFGKMEIIDVKIEEL